MLLRFEYPKTFDDLLEDTVASTYVSPGASTPAMDITEYENEYVAVVELPGVKKEDVKITFEKNVLTVEGVRKPYEIPQDARVLLNEIRVRDFSRSIRVPAEIDATNISAELENGILKVVLPKSIESRVRTIAIK
jgi:HSP20 family protein